MAAPAVRVEGVFKTSSSFFDYFIIGESLIGGSDIIAGADSETFDISSYVNAISIRRGRHRELDEFGPGVLTLELDNADRAWDPDNPNSPFYGQIEPMREFQVIATVADVDYPLIVAYAEDWTPSEADGGLPTVTMEAVDLLGVLGRQDLDEIAPDHAGDLSGARINRVLDLPEIALPADKRAIDDGLSVFGDTIFGENAAQYLQAAAQSEMGFLFVASDGDLTFLERGASAGSIRATFSDEGDADSISYERFERSFSNDLLFNRVITAGTTEVEQLAEDTESQDAYQVRTLRRTGQMVADDDEMLSQAQWLVGRFARPELRFKHFDLVDLVHLSDARQIELVDLELHDRVFCERTIDVGVVVSQNAVVDGLEWTIEGADVFRLSVTVSGGNEQFGFVIGDAALGVIGTSRISY